MLATTSSRVPSRVTAGSRAWARSSLRRRSARSWAPRIRETSSGVAFKRSVPLVPSRMTAVPSASSRAAGSTPASAGMPIDRARIAECEVEPPRVVQKPTTFVRSSPAVSEGVRSSAMRMLFGLCSGCLISAPVRIDRTRSPTSRRSFARWASS